MKIKSLFTFTAITLVMYSCNQTETKMENENPAVSAVEAAEHTHNGDNIELDNGKKWKVVPEMMAYIKAMETDINQFTVSNNIKDFNALGEKLQKNLDLLTSNCTMEGKAHDELHKWLLPYIAMVEKFNKAENNQEAERIFSELKSSFNTLNSYFE